MEEHWGSRNTAWEVVKKSKVQLELNLARGVNNKKGYYGSISHNKKVKGSVSPPVSKTRKLITIDNVKTEGIKNFSCLSLHWKPFFPHLLSV